MPLATELTRKLGLEHPIIQAPMGGASTVALAAATCNVGALGFIAAAYLTPEQIEETARDLRARTARPFGINLFAPLRLPELPEASSTALERLSAVHEQLNLDPPELPKPMKDDFEEKLAACLDSGAAIFSFTFGIPPASAVQCIKERGMMFVGTATTVTEAVMLEEVGADAIVAQGSEAGAHRGSFAADFEAAMIGTLALVPQVVDAVAVPVVASGGIMDGRGLAAALALGASAVQLGTAFLTCPETGIPEVHKEVILTAGEHETTVTRAFSGRPARGLVNRFVTDTEAQPEAILPYPYQNLLTRAMRTTAAQRGDKDYLSLWAGQGVRLARRQPAAELIERIVREGEDVIDLLGAMRRG